MFLMIFFAISYLWFVHGADVQHGSVKLPCHMTWIIPCHKSESSIAQGNNTWAITFAIFHARKSHICAWQMGQRSREARGWQRAVRGVRVRDSCVTPMLSTWDDMSAESELASSQKTPKRRLNCPLKDLASEHTTPATPRWANVFRIRRQFHF